MMDESKTPPPHLGSCRYLTLYRGVLDFVHHSKAILYHAVPNPNLTIRAFLIAVDVLRILTSAVGVTLKWSAPRHLETVV
jgi:hypothetical protein